MKACVECKYFKGVTDAYMGHIDPRSVQQPECLHPLAGSRDPIYGKALCHNERNAGFKKTCGKEGKNWTPKDSQKA